MTNGNPANKFTQHSYLGWDFSKTIGYFRIMKHSRISGYILLIIFFGVSVLWTYGRSSGISSRTNDNTGSFRNVLILYSDDHSYHALGAMGNTEVMTPNLDRLASGGMLFTQAHVMGGHQGAVCIPSRAMLLTGRYVNRLPADGSLIPDSLVSLPEVLRQKGYTTYHTGKWHSDKSSHHRMFSSGGDIFFGGMHFEKEGGQVHPVVQPFDPAGIYPAYAKRSSDTFSSSLYAENAIRFLNSPVARKSPFFCYVAFTSPHDPRTPPRSASSLYDTASVSLPPNFLPAHPFDNGDMNVRDEQLFPRPLKSDIMKQDIANYYAMITEMDEQVGRILDALERNGLTKNTLVVFAGDNGLAVGQHGLLGKQNLYEHSIRVPMILSGPGIHAGSRYDGFIYLSDLAPTIFEYLGVQMPKTVEAKSHLPVIHDNNLRLRKNIYNIYGSWSRSIKTADGFKLILYNVEGALHTQLFDLKHDPWETRNLAEDPMYSARIREMRELLGSEMRLMYDDLNIEKPDWGRLQANRKGRGS
jgi:arylsulfatase A-like enzyme